jgi:hypothetical protein
MPQELQPVQRCFPVWSTSRSQDRLVAQADIQEGEDQHMESDGDDEESDDELTEATIGKRPWGSRSAGTLKDSSSFIRPGSEESAGPSIDEEVNADITKFEKGTPMVRVEHVPNQRERDSENSWNKLTEVEDTFELDPLRAIPTNDGQNVDASLDPSLTNAFDPFLAAANAIEDSNLQSYTTSQAKRSTAGSTCSQSEVDQALLRDNQDSPATETSKHRARCEETPITLQMPGITKNEIDPPIARLTCAPTLLRGLANLTTLLTHNCICQELGDLDNIGTRTRLESSSASDKPYQEARPSPVDQTRLKRIALELFALARG